MKLYRTQAGVIVESDDRCYAIDNIEWDELFNAPDLPDRLAAMIKGQPAVTLDATTLQAPLDGQEVWAAGVTYYRSRDARMEEAEAAGGSDFYARVYSADRPELFFKGSRSRVVGQGEQIRIRADSQWNVPEPELTVAINRSGSIIGYTIGNDVSSRDIEGENPLYLPQAKVYDRCCALGPGVLISPGPLDDTTGIALEIERDGSVAFSGSTSLEQLKRKPPELVEYLFRDNVFPQGCFLLTGTGIVPPSTFTLQSNDLVRITIDSIGTLENTVM